MRRATAERLLERPLARPRSTLRIVPKSERVVPRLHPDGQAAFLEILTAVDEARESIEIRAFVWRDDETGNMLASALLRAANRGVQIEIQKDRIGANYEYFGGNHQSFFHKKIDFTQRLQTLFLHNSYPVNRGSFTQRPNVLARAMLEHPNITVNHVQKTFDHAKLYIFDKRQVILGGMGIGDEHRREWFDVMVSLDSPELVARLNERITGRQAFDPGRHIDFLVHDRRSARNGTDCPMLGQRLALIDQARKSVTVAMAYLGDRRFTEALTRAVQRGVHVTLVSSVMADILGDLLRATCDELLRDTGAPDNLTVVLLPRMVHAKVLVIDGEIADVGSANFTPLSHGVYSEVDVYVRDRTFAQQVEQTVLARLDEGELMGRRVRFSRIFEIIERAIVVYQSRDGV